MNDTIVFGDVGAYDYSTNSLDTTEHDGIINFVDIEYIENFYKTYKDPESTTQPTPEEIAIMNAAGFNQPYTDSHSGTSYTSYLEIPYAVTSINVNASTTWDDLTPIETDYERMIQGLRASISKTAASNGFGGDADLDGNITNNDVVFLQDVLNHGAVDSDAELLYIFNKLYAQYGNASTDIGVIRNIVTKAYQSYCNCNLYEPEKQELTDKDLIILQTTLDNVFNISKFPVDTAVWEGTDAVFEVILPNDDTYTYEWTIQLPGSTIPQPISGATTHILTLPNVTQDKSNSLIAVKITRGNPSAERTYSAKLFVGSETDTFFGDVDSNGSVNIIDAYKILNNFLYYFGDVNKDEHIDGSDASIVERYYSQVSTGKTPQEAVDIVNSSSGLNNKISLLDIERGDVNQNGLTDMTDASLILGIYSRLNTGRTIPQVEAELGVTIDSSNLNLPATTLGELAALLTVNGVRLTAYNKIAGELILASIKDKNIHLS